MKYSYVCMHVHSYVFGFPEDGTSVLKHGGILGVMYDMYLFYVCLSVIVIN